MGGPFRQIVEQFAPGFMLGPNFRKLCAAVGGTLDAAAQRSFDGMISAIPYCAGAKTRDGVLLQCGADVLSEHAKDRGIMLYPTEPEASRRYRLSRWRQLKRRRGSHLGEIEHVRPYFLGIGAGIIPEITIVHQDAGGSSATWHNVDSSGVYTVQRITPSNFDYDGQTTKYTRWVAFIRMSGTGIAPPPTYGSGHLYGDGTLYGVGGLTTAQHADLVAMLLDWQAAHSLCIGVALVWDPAAVPITGTPTQDSDGRWSLPNGANTWSVLADPGTGKATRPYGVEWIYDPGPG